MIDGKWVTMHPADVTQAGNLTEMEFRKAFPDLPAMPGIFR